MKMQSFVTWALLLYVINAAEITRNHPSKLTFYDGQFIDETIPWKEDLENPLSGLFGKLRSEYSAHVKNALVTRNPHLYRDAQVTISDFKGQRLSAKRTAINVQFVLGLHTHPSSVVDIETDLEKGSQSLHHDWRSIQIEKADLPPLPEPDHSDGWKAAAKMFLESMNTSVDPCHDFYRYSCDNYIAKHPLSGAAKQSTFDELQKTVFINLTKAFEKLETHMDQEKSETLKITTNIYKACKAVKNDTYAGSKILDDIANEYGGWPILDSTWDINKVPNNIFWMMGSIFTKYGVPTLFVPQVEIDARNIQKHILYLDEANLAIPADYYRSPNLTQRYQDVLRKTIYQTVQAMSKKIDNVTVLPQIDRMVKIEYHLAMISVNASEQRNMSLGYNPYDVASAEKQFPAFNWKSYFKGLLESVFQDDPSTLLNPFIVAEPRRYGRDLNKFLSDISKDPSATKDLVNYLVFRLINPYMQFAGPELKQIALELKKQVRMEEVDVSEQEQQCVSNLAAGLPYAAGRLYVDTNFPQQNRDDVAVMINNVLSAFSSSLSGLRWMDNESALKAFNKVAGLVRNVAYADFQQDDSKLDAFHQWLIKEAQKIDPSDKQAYYKYSRQVTFFQGRVLFEKLKKHSDRQEFGMSPAIVNAWYQPIRNSITFPAAILNQPFYRYDFPQAVNYGGLGVVMGHELSHGFDDQGVQFDWDGTLHTWMTQHAESGFTKMAQCVVDEYSSFCYPQACINGITTQGENIGDNGGIKAAYRAYKAYVASHGEEKPLPGMETFTMDQIFFLAYGQVWCGSYSEDALTRQLLTNPHSPGKDRVIGAVKNFPKFAEAFNCKKGDPMYPVNACDVW